MRIGLLDVDQYNKTAKFPNIALMKISAYHKAQGHDVDWWFGFEHYDRVYISKVFDGIVQFPCKECQESQEQINVIS